VIREISPLHERAWLRRMEFILDGPIPVAAAAALGTLTPPSAVSRPTHWLSMRRADVGVGAPGETAAAHFIGDDLEALAHHGLIHGVGDPDAFVPVGPVIVLVAEEEVVSWNDQHAARLEAAVMGSPGNQNHRNSAPSLRCMNQSPSSPKASKAAARARRHFSS
jgi:hypothetical protein